MKEPANGTGPRPAVIGLVAVLLGAVLTGGWLLALRSTRTQPAPPQPPTAQQQLEEAVAANPDDLEARRQLGDLHFAADRFDLALEQYLVVLNSFPHQAQTLARAGWIAFEAGDSATGHRLVAQSLAVAGNNAEALWYLAQIRLYGLDDARGAVAPLRRLLRRDDLDAPLRRAALRLIATASDGVGDVTKGRAGHSWQTRGDLQRDRGR